MQMPPRRCVGCGALVTGRCATCRRQRPTPSAQGYNSRAWRSFRLLQLSLHPFCAECLRAGVRTVANTVDHIEPVTGSTDPHFLDYAAVQSLCASCHSSKTATEDSTFANRGGCRTR